MLRPCLRRLGALLIGVWLWLWDSGWRLLSYFRHRRIARRVHHPLLLNSATALGRKIRAREVTSVELVKAMVERIQEIAYLNAVALPNYEATLDEARTVDRRVAAGNVPSAETAPFFGVPFTLKDAVFVRGLRCTAGIPARGAVSAAAEDSEAVRNLRLAGAIGPLAVTNVSEVCMWWESTNGLFGRSCNPYDHRRIVGGSSGGEGCLIAAGGSIFGIGSDIGGSIRMPAFFNGIFGHKPSKFVVSDHGAFPPTHGYQKTMFSKGPMCRYAEDLAPMLRALGGPAAEAQLRLSERPVPFPRLRIFYMEGIRSRFISSLHPDMLEAMRKVIRYMETRYESACIRLDLPLAHKALPIYFNDLDVEEAPDFAEIMTDHTGRLKPGPEEKAKLVLLRDRLCKELESLLGDDGVLLFPSHPTAAPFHHQPLGQPFNFIYTGLFNSLALPVTQVPLGLGSDGVPLGLQVVGGNGKDRVTLGLAEELERAFGGWVNFSR